MRFRAFAMLILAGVLGVGAVFAAQTWLEKQRPSVPVVVEAERPELAKVVVADRPLHFGDEIRPDFLRVVEWPTGAVPDGSFASVEELIAGEKRVALRSIAMNEPVLRERVSGYGGRPVLSSMISPEKRAVTVRVNDVLGVGGFILPGDRIDFLLTREEDEKRFTDVLLQDIRVLGVDQEASEDREQPMVVKTVTVEVNTEQSQKVALASQIGTLSMALRQQGASGAEKARRIDVDDLVEYEAKPQVAAAAAPAPAPAPRVARAPSVTVVRALQASTVTVVREGRDPTSLRPASAPRSPAATARPAEEPSERLATPEAPATTVPMVAGPMPLTPQLAQR